MPNKFAKDLNTIFNGSQSTYNADYFSPGTCTDPEILAYYDFELDDSMVEELVSLAISFALENVESTRLNTHLGIRGLEGWH